MAKTKPRRVVQDLAAIDQFGELASRKREAVRIAHAHGHQLGSWHRRPNDPAGRFNAYCTDCNAPAVVCTEVPDGIEANIYGHALMIDCRVRQSA